MIGLSFDFKACLEVRADRALADLSEKRGTSGSKHVFEVGVELFDFRCLGLRSLSEVEVEVEESSLRFDRLEMELILDNDFLSDLTDSS